MEFKIDDIVVLNDDVTEVEINRNTGALSDTVKELIKISKKDGLKIWRISEVFEKVGDENIFRYADLSFKEVKGDYKSHLFKKK